MRLAKRMDAYMISGVASVELSLIIRIMIPIDTHVPIFKRLSRRPNIPQRNIFTENFFWTAIRKCFPVIGRPAEVPEIYVRWVVCQCRVSERCNIRALTIVFQIERSSSKCLSMFSVSSGWGKSSSLGVPFSSTIFLIGAKAVIKFSCFQKLVWIWYCFAIEKRLYEISFFLF